MDSYSAGSRVAGQNESPAPLHKKNYFKVKPLLKIFVDADGSPVKTEVYRTAGRHGLQVAVVANSWMRVPDHATVEMVVVDGKFDAADDWIVEHCGEDDIVITTDIPLAARCLKNNSRVLRPNGREFTEDNIGEALASREMMSDLRDLGTITGGPSPFQNRDRSRFLHRLDEIIQIIRRKP
jgi:uncharacterized protein YaiI (UPF0178 family)